MRTADIFLGRQPIIDRERKLAAYELLYRSAFGSATASVTDDAAATAQVIRRAFHDIGVNTVLGPCQGFINVDAEMLMGHAIEALPKERVVLELLETIAVDEGVVRRCRELKQRGYRLALDDFISWDERYEPLLEIVDIVKVDILGLDRDALTDLVFRLKLYPARLLAEKVETWERARQCLNLGFDLFQGFLFGRPALLAA